MIRTLIWVSSRYPINRKVIKKAVEGVFVQFNLESLNFEVSIALVGKRKMNDLSSKFLQDREKHAVLSFASEVSGEKSVGFVNPPQAVLGLGDVVLCWPWVVERAAQDNVLVDEEVKRLVIHGVKHLLGEDHGSLS